MRKNRRTLGQGVWPELTPNYKYGNKKTRWETKWTLYKTTDRKLKLSGHMMTLFWTCK